MNQEKWFRKKRTADIFRKKKRECEQRENNLKEVYKSVAQHSEDYTYDVDAPIFFPMSEENSPRYYPASDDDELPNFPMEEDDWLICLGFVKNKTKKNSREFFFTWFLHEFFFNDRNFNLSIGYWILNFKRGIININNIAQI